MNSGSWIALAALLLTGMGMAAGIVYRLGQLAARQQDLIRRVQRIEDKIDRVPKRRAGGNVD